MKSKVGLATVSFLLGLIVMGLFYSINYGRMVEHLDCNKSVERQHLEHFKTS